MLWYKTVYNCIIMLYIYFTVAKSIVGVKRTPAPSHLQPMLILTSTSPGGFQEGRTYPGRTSHFTFLEEQPLTNNNSRDNVNYRRHTTSDKVSTNRNWSTSEDQRHARPYSTYQDGSDLRTSGVYDDALRSKMHDVRYVTVVQDVKRTLFCHQWFLQRV